MVINDFNLLFCRISAVSLQSTKPRIKAKICRVLIRTDYTKDTTLLASKPRFYPRKMSTGESTLGWEVEKTGALLAA